MEPADECRWKQLLRGNYVVNFGNGSFLQTETTFQGAPIQYESSESPTAHLKDGASNTMFMSEVL